MSTDWRFAWADPACVLHCLVPGGLSSQPSFHPTCRVHIVQTVPATMARQPALVTPCNNIEVLAAPVARSLGFRSNVGMLQQVGITINLQ
jgi:hypothetical protein